MFPHTARCDAVSRPCLADLLAEREPAREARRLLTYVCAVSRRPPLDRDLVTAMSARCHAEEMCTSVNAALWACDPAAALAAADRARRALLHLRAVLHVALGERLLHRVQFDILARQAARTQRALVELGARAQACGAAVRAGTAAPGCRAAVRAGAAAPGCRAAVRAGTAALGGRAPAGAGAAVGRPGR